jgi:glutamate-1-semialdehyde aminotransferase/spore coat polysaccharide biosynthesis protein SpsF (cytidylyltransferase family)
MNQDSSHINAILQARMSSSRLPGKVLMPILGEPMLARQIERIRRSKLIDQLIIATSSDVTDDPIDELCQRLGVTCFRGHLNHVLDRFYQASRVYPSAHIVRLTGDCPLSDPRLIDQVIDTHLQGGYDYTSNTLVPTYPDGLDVEVFRTDCLKVAWTEAIQTEHKEHVTPFIYQLPDRFNCLNVRSSMDYSHLRWTVDHPQDLELIQSIYTELYPKNPLFQTQDILDLIHEKQDFQDMNKDIERNENFKGDAMHRYYHSEELLNRALKVIPLGSQTFSKSKTQYPYGVSPYFIDRGLGSHVWDVDGHEYIDFVNALASITLGYGDADVTHAVQQQLSQGTIFSLSHSIEVEVAEKIIELVPCAEMVRFGKNGSDATSGAIRIARAYTGRDRIAVCGYHGWHDWYIGSTSRNLGIPKEVQDLTHTFTYNHLDSLKDLLEQYPNEFAAVILEPMNVVYPNPGFLEGLRELTHETGCVLIFDETITGFRYGTGGAQECFGVTPDLTTLGKGIANGYPLSAIVGRRDLMNVMEDIFFSSTFGGETLSLAAALATLNKLQSHGVIDALIQKGEWIITEVNHLIKKHQVQDFISISGHPTWSFLLINAIGDYSQAQLKTLFLQEVFKRGILTLGTHNLSYSHSDQDLHKLIEVYDQVFPILKESIEHQSLPSMLQCEPLVPLFKVR